MLEINKNRKFKLRVKYKKEEPAIWISHLETLRSIMRWVRRANLPFLVTSGYSPHMKISFSPALSVGIDACFQEFDVYLNKYIDPKKCFQALSSVSGDFFIPLSCKYVDNDDSLGFSVGDIYSYQACVNVILDKISVPEYISIKKKSKEKIINVAKIASDVKIINETSFNMASKNPVLMCDKHGWLSFVLTYTQNGIIKPELFVREVLTNSGFDDAEILKIKLVDIVKS